MTSPTPTPEQLDTLRHMLGINDPCQRVPQPYRNYAAVNPGDAQYTDMAQAGLIERYRQATTPNEYDYYRCTDAGRVAALASHKSIRLSKSKRVYLKFLEIREVFQDLTFRDFLVEPQFAETRRSA